MSVKVVYTGQKPSIINKLADFLRVDKGTDHYSKLAGDVIIQQIKQGFDAGTTPGGIAWKPIKNRVGKPLVNTGKLRNGFKKVVKGRIITITNQHIGAATHNEGAIRHAKRAPFMVFKVMGRTVRAKKVVIPKRQFIPLNGEPFPSQWARQVEIVTVNRIRTILTGNS